MRIRLRAGRSREVIGTVAAVVVVVLLAGLLAVLFRGSGETPSAGAGAVASPSSAAPGTPSNTDQLSAAASMPATRSATVITRATVNTSGQDFYTFEQAQQLAPFSIALPQWRPSYLAEPVITISAAAPPHTVPTPQQVIAVNFDFGPTDQSQQYRVAIVEHGGPLNIGFPNTKMKTINGQPVMRTIQRDGTDSIGYFFWQDQGTSFELTAELADPLTEQDVEHIIASMLDGDDATPPASTSTTPAGLPTPDSSGRYRGLTFEQAQQNAPFKLYMPAYIPPSFKYPWIDLMLPPLPPTANAQGVPIKAILAFDANDGGDRSVSLMETSLTFNPANVSGAPATILSPSGTPIEIPEEGILSTVQIDGTTVTRHLVAGGVGQPITMYFWVQGKTTMVLTAVNTQPASDQDIQQMIASMIAQGS